MRLHLFVAVFTAFWMAVTMTVAAQTLAQFAGGSGTAGYVLFVSLFPLFGGTLAAVRYYPERRKAMRLLVDAVQPELQSKT